MTAWIVLPVSLSAFSITGIWIVWVPATLNIMCSLNPSIISNSSGIRTLCLTFLALDYGVFLVPQVCHGCDESPCLSCGELVSDFSVRCRTSGHTVWLHKLNWLCHCCRSYNVTCTEELPRPGFPKTCCTIQDIPLIRSQHSVHAKAHESAPCYVVAQSLTL